jgi:hypothetical protein
MMDSAVREALAQAEKMRPMHEWMQSRVVEYQKEFSLAVAGDNKALVRLFNESGVSMLEDEPIRTRIDDLRYALEPDRDVLERIARAITASLLRPKTPGRKSRTPRELLTHIQAIQAAFEGCPKRLKKTYRNFAIRERDIRAISDHVATAVPLERRQEIAAAAARVLAGKPGVTKSFGIDVVAESLSRSSRWIRSTQKKKRQ